MKVMSRKTRRMSASKRANRQHAAQAEGRHEHARKEPATKRPTHRADKPQSDRQQSRTGEQASKPESKQAGAQREAAHTQPQQHNDFRPSGLRKIAGGEGRGKQPNEIPCNVPMC